MREGEGLDLTVFLLILPLPIGFFALATSGTFLFYTTVTFAIILYGSAIGLLAVSRWLPEIGEGEGDVADFDRNLTLYGLTVGVGMGVLVLALAAILMHADWGRLLYVPQPNVSLPFSLALVDSQTLGNILYQLTFTVSGGSVSPSVAYTDSSGWAYTTWSTPITEGTYSYTASVYNPDYDMTGITEHTVQIQVTSAPSPKTDTVPVEVSVTTGTGSVMKTAGYMDVTVESPSVYAPTTGPLILFLFIVMGVAVAGGVLWRRS